jgi:hypothetical protein
MRTMHSVSACSALLILWHKALCWDAVGLWTRWVRAHALLTCIPFPVITTRYVWTKHTFSVCWVFLMRVTEMYTCSRIWRFHGSEYKDGGHLGCSAVLSSVLEVCTAPIITAMTLPETMTSETSVNSHQSTRRYNPEDGHLHVYVYWCHFGSTIELFRNETDG